SHLSPCPNVQVIPLMGQDWQIVNLTQEISELVGKLGEHFFDGYLAQMLVKRIRRPQYIELDSVVGMCKPGSVAFNGKWTRALFPVNLKLDKSTWLCPMRVEQSSECMLLHSLPFELFSLICEDLDNEDLIFLSVTCQHLWDLCRPSLYERITRLCNRRYWSGHRLVCFGDGVANNDIPDSILSLDERAKYLVITDGQATNDYHSTVTLYKYEFTSAPSFDSSVSLDSELLMKAHKRNCHRDILHAQTLCHSLHHICYSDMVVKSTTASTSCILRNLTKQQYVRETELFKMKDKYWNPHPGRHNNLSLGHIVFGRICWSSNSSVSMGRDDSIELHRGVWAGDRFDIISDSDEEWVKELQQETSRWKDVSRDAVDELERIYRWECLS
ncbi:unnamed protein product, partial [Mycena citricolor]